MHCQSVKLVVNDARLHCAEGETTFEPVALCTPANNAIESI
jgi:hypothetical protein